MKKQKLQKGITLIALIITIVVLLILAAVTIGAIQKSKIIAHAQNAASGYNKAKDNELDALGSYEQLIDDNNPNGDNETQIEFDDDYISQVLTSWFVNEEEDETLLYKLKQHLSITDENINRISDIAILSCTDEDEYSDLSIYLYDIDRLYKMDKSTNTIIYARKEEEPDKYTFGQNVKIIKVELEKVFVGKTVSEILEKYNAGTLEEYISNNSEVITVNEPSKGDWTENSIRVRSLFLKNGNNKINLGYEQNYTIMITDDGEIYDKVIIEWRNLI